MCRGRERERERETERDTKRERERLTYILACAKCRGKGNIGEEKEEAKG